MENTLELCSSMWGLPINNYLLEFSHRTPSKKKPTQYEIKQAIELIKSGYPSCADFELLLSLADRSGYLRTFLDDSLVPGCMRLLREYCQANSVRNDGIALLQGLIFNANSRYLITPLVFSVYAH
jgi:hypothetical protein